MISRSEKTKHGVIWVFGVRQRAAFGLSSLPGTMEFRRVCFLLILTFGIASALCFCFLGACL